MFPSCSITILLLLHQLNFGRIHILSHFLPSYPATTQHAIVAFVIIRPNLFCGTAFSHWDLLKMNLSHSLSKPSIHLSVVFQWWRNQAIAFSRLGDDPPPVRLLWNDPRSPDSRPDVSSPDARRPDASSPDVSVAFPNYPRLRGPKWPGLHKSPPLRDEMTSNSVTAKCIQVFKRLLVS